MGRRQRHVYHVEPSRFPPDFPECLERLLRETGLSRRALARELRVEARTLRRWRNGAQPGPGHLYRLFAFAAGRGLLQCLLPGVAAPSEQQAGGGGPTGDECSGGDHETFEEAEEADARAGPGDRAPPGGAPLPAELARLDGGDQSRLRLARERTGCGPDRVCAAPVPAPPGPQM